MDIDNDLPQDYEQIPWSHLVPEQKDRTLQLAAVAIVLIAVFVAIVLFIRRAPTPSLVVASTTAVPPAVTAPAPDVPEAISIAPSSTEAIGTRIYSEADLMAVLPPPDSDLQLEAIARAEWFVTDFFTVDGDASLADGINAVLPDVVELPRSDGSSISYVEWARAVDVMDHTDGSFEVTVWFRTLVGNADSGFSRTGVRAVTVPLITDELGRLAVADIPAVAALTPSGIGPRWPAGQTPPPDVVAAATGTLGEFGGEPELQSAGETDRGWRVVFSIGDASGLRFPIAVRLAP